MTETVTVGGATVTALLDSQGPFLLPLSEAFPSVEPVVLERAEPLDPDPRPSPDRWWLAFRVCVVEAVRTRTALLASARSLGAPLGTAHLHAAFVPA